MKTALQSAIPVLRIGDYPQALAFYRDLLGFEIVEEGGDPPLFGILRKDRAQIFLDAWRGPEPEPAPNWRAYFHIADADGFAAEMRGHTITIERGPETMPYGMREVEIRDPGGNLLCFGQDIDTP